MLWNLFRGVAGIGFSAASCFAAAQDFSYDGNRWYEVEISVFTNEQLDFQGSEYFIPERTRLSYPENTSLLRSLVAGLTIDFEAAAALDELPPEAEQPALTGPVYSPPGNDFRVPDFARDAFIALGEASSVFKDFNRDIDNSPEHRLLYHAVWRQPVLNRVQALPVFVRGGDRYGEHNELEGSLMVSYNVNRIDLDVNLWLSRFQATDSVRRSAWSLPDQPFPADQPETDPVNFLVTDVAHQLQTRSMRSNVLHYIDHPALGVLVEMRPYQLPDNLSLD